jgi:flagellar biosynthesis GTPase FlhF
MTSELVWTFADYEADRKAYVRKADALRKDTELKKARILRKARLTQKHNAQLLHKAEAKHRADCLQAHVKEEFRKEEEAEANEARDALTKLNDALVKARLLKAEPIKAEVIKTDVIKAEAELKAAQLAAELLQEADLRAELMAELKAELAEELLRDAELRNNDNTDTPNINTVPKKDKPPQPRPIVILASIFMLFWLMISWRHLLLIDPYTSPVPKEG